MPRSISLVALASLIPLAALSAACTVTTQPEPAATYTTTSAVYADDDPAPVNIETYPSVVYEGQPAYFYHDHWYRRDARGHYAYYRQEPPELHRQRGYIQQAHPAGPPREEERHEERR